MGPQDEPVVAGEVASVAIVNAFAMNVAVFFHFVQSFEGSSTKIAFVWSFGAVGLEMFFEGVDSQEVSAADLALVIDGFGFDSRVSFDVSIVSPFGVKFFVANLAIVIHGFRVFANVETHVSVELGLARKIIAARTAVIRRFLALVFAVDFHVTIVFRFVRRLEAARSAFVIDTRVVLSIVDIHVTIVLWLGGKLESARLALVAFLARSLSVVHVHVSLVFRFVFEQIAARFAHEDRIAFRPFKIGRFAKSDD